MKVLLVGGGSGGHVTPLVAVANQLKQLQPEAQFYSVCDYKFAPQAARILQGIDANVEQQVIFAGKWRRYHGVSWFKRLIDIKTHLLNLRDVAYVAIGFVQSVYIMARFRPNVVFIKGGFVGVPVGLAAWLTRRPVVLHDSDTTPGLANKIVANFAKQIATGSPLKYYNYPKQISHYVGVPISQQFEPLTLEQKQAARAAWDLPDAKRPLLVVTGGGLGARRINQAIVALAPELIDRLGMSIIHITGQLDYEQVSAEANKSAHYKLLPFVHQDMAKLLGSADVVVSRAGATTILELAAVSASIILVPHPNLSGGHQLKNAQVYQDSKAVLVVQESELKASDQALFEAIAKLVNNRRYRQELADNLSQFAKLNAASDVAKLILKVAKG